MNKNKILIASISAILLFSGCSNDASVPPSTVETTQTVVDTSEGSQNNKDIPPVDKFLWEKERVQFSLEQLTLDSDWTDYITVGEQKITSTAALDVSSLNNYFFDDEYTYAGLETAYHVPTLDYWLYTDINTEDKLYSGSMSVLCSSMNQNVAVSGIQVSGIVSPHDNGLSKFKENNSNKDRGFFGIGNSYADVKSIIGEATSASIDEADAVSFKQEVYQSDNAELFLIFEKDKNSDVWDDAVLTTIKWVPTKVRTQIQSQDGIEDFVNYNNQSNDEIDETSETVIPNPEDSSNTLVDDEN